MIDWEERALKKSLWSGDCLLYIGSKTGAYGALRDNDGVFTGLHIQAYSRYNGNLEEGEVVRHTCNNKRCWNHKHLLKGTQAENIADSVRDNLNAKGECHGHAVLKEKDVLAIRAHPKGYSLKRLAKEYGVSQATIVHIRSRRTWKHLP